jgi:xanthine dehydrogenase large subunit
MHRPVDSHAAATAVHMPHPHESAHLHVSGEAIYVDDIPELAGTLHDRQHRAHAQARPSRRA